MKNDEVYLHHILDAISQIEEYTAGIDRAAFEENRLLQDGVTRQLEIVGEASRQLSDAFCERHAEVPWHAIVGMRNRINHDYLNIDLDVIWDTVHHDLPVLKRFVQDVIK